MISKGESSVSLDDVLEMTDQCQIACHYLGIQKIPCVISSPLRKDDNPSFAIYSPNGTDVNYIDFSTKDKGTIFTLLMKLWNKNLNEVCKKIFNDFKHFTRNHSIRKTKYRIQKSSSCELKVKIREWKDYDIEYWNSYGISLPWLKYANVYPISHKFIIKNKTEYMFLADKYAYAYVEFKEGKTSVKIYQPFNKKGFKWATSTDKSVISLWTKIPIQGEKLVICSSLKDSLCLWSNTGIPAICTQGEGYPISNTAITELKKRYKDIYILFDNDDAGIKDAKVLSEMTGFKNITLPKINGQKDVSDIYKSLEDKKDFKGLILNLIN